MNINTDVKKSLFLGDWAASTLEGEERLLSRKVRINGKTYLMKVEYRGETSNNPNISSQEQLLVKKVIENSEKQIEKFVQTQSAQSKKNFSVSLKTGCTQSTINAFLQRFNILRDLGYKLLAALKLTDRRGEVAESKLLNSLSNEYDNFTSLTQKARMEYLNQGSPLSSGISEKKVIDRVDTKWIGANQAQRALDLIEHLKLLGDEGTVSYKGKKYTIPAEDKYGRRKWQLDIDGVGYEINEYGDRAYNGVTTEDFIKRQELILSAALQYLENKKLPNEEAVKKAIATLDLEFQKELQKKEYLVDWRLIKSGEDITDQYAEINKRATKRISQFAKDVQHVIDSALGEEDSFSIEDLDFWERKLVHKRDRPVIINTYIHNGRKFINMHSPESRGYTSKTAAVPKKTIPSTIRDRSGISNYITSYGGTIREDGKVVITYNAIRHSSYPPIRVRSDCLRQAIAAENVKQGLRDLAYKSLMSKPRETSREDPLVIPLRSMMLLTPKKGDFLRNRSKVFSGEWIGESEVLQLVESNLALRMFHGRTIPLKLGNDIVWVKPDLSIMNLGANPEAAGIGMFGKLPTHGFQNRINARGFVEFVSEVEEVFDTSDLPEPISKIIKEIEQLEKSHKKYRHEQQEVSLALSANESELKVLYTELEELYAQFLKSSDSALKPRISSTINKIQAKENAVYKAHIGLVKSMRKGYLEKQHEIEEKEQQLYYLFNEHRNLADTDEEKARLAMLRDVRQNFRMAKSVFYSGGCTKAGTVMEFQTLYIHTHSMLNNFIELFCKSGEDRTGRVDDKVQEREVFRETEMKVPASKLDFKVLNELIALIVHQYSVSQNTTEQNSNARGEQISYKVNPEIPAEHDRLQATMAKRVIAGAKNLTPSNEAVQTVGRYKLISVAV